MSSPMILCFVPGSKWNCPDPKRVFSSILKNRKKNLLWLTVSMTIFLSGSIILRTTTGRPNCISKLRNWMIRIAGSMGCSDPTLPFGPFSCSSILVLQLYLSSWGYGPIQVLRSTGRTAFRQGLCCSQYYYGSCCISWDEWERTGGNPRCGNYTNS